MPVLSIFKSIERLLEIVRWELKYMMQLRKPA